MTVSVNELRFIKNTVGYNANICSAMARLLKNQGYNIFSSEAVEKMMELDFYSKAERYAQYITIQNLIYEFGPFEYSDSKREEK